jgi:hypothetical protein
MTYCDICGVPYVISFGKRRIDDKYAGSFIVDNIEYEACPNCGDILLSPESAFKIEKVRFSIIDSLLNSFPLKDFVSSSEASAILGISRQALHKSKKINLGLVFHAQLSDKTVYLRKSLELFRDTGDGRFPLGSRIAQPDIASPFYQKWTGSSKSHIMYNRTIGTAQARLTAVYESGNNRL